MDILTVQTIFNQLVKREKVLSKDNIKLLASTLEYAVKQGELYYKDGFYSVNEILTKILGFNKSMWRVLRQRSPEILEFVKQETITSPGARGGTPPHMISDFGVFYMAALVKYTGDRDKDQHKPLVYIFEDPGNCAFKIGATINLNIRIKTMHSSNPFAMLALTFEVESLETEKKLHRILYPHAIPDAFGWYYNKRTVRDIINKFMIDNGYTDKPHPRL